eukprot:scaffold13450_cov18-Prasinocladus_malaysianus.AAC.1
MRVRHIHSVCNVTHIDMTLCKRLHYKFKICMGMTSLHEDFLQCCFKDSFGQPIIYTHALGVMGVYSLGRRLTALFPLSHSSGNLRSRSLTYIHLFLPFGARSFVFGGLPAGGRMRQTWAAHAAAAAAVGPGCLRRPQMNHGWWPSRHRHRHRLVRQTTRAADGSPSLAEEVDL